MAPIGPFLKKFGCDFELAPYLLRRAEELGLDPYGVSFHVGSQQRNLDQWDIALQKSATIFETLGAEGIDLKMVNIGGGFPSVYRAATPSVEDHSAAINEGMARHFGNGLPEIIAEPGRYIAGDAGVIQTEIVLIANKSRMGGRRWVYLDVGRFGGLAEVMDEAIQYRIRTPYGDNDCGPVVIAGPTCDEADVLYENADYQLPLALKTGDKIEVLSTGAYTASYSAVGFNGFSPVAGNLYLTQDHGEISQSGFAASPECGLKGCVMKIHGYFRSSAAYRVRIALNLKNIECDTALVNLQAGDQSSSAYRLINPQGRVPTLEIDDQILVQSLAIIEFSRREVSQPAAITARAIGKSTRPRHC